MRHLFAVMVLAGAPAGAENLAARFAARPAAMSVVLSPDGDKVAYIGAYKTGGRAVFVADLKTGDSKAVLAGASLEVVPRRCVFKTETRLVCTLYGLFNVVDYAKLSNFTRIMAVDTDGQNRKLLGETKGGGRFSGGVMNWLPDDPTHILMSAEDGVAAIDIHTGVKRFAERFSQQTMQLASDDTGAVRLRGVGSADPDGITRDSMTYLVRAKGSRTWQSLFNVKLSDERAPDFAGFDASGEHLYELAPFEGRAALFKVATDGSGTRELVYANQQVDVDGVMRIGKYRRAVGASYTVDRDEVAYFDPELARLSTVLGKSLPGHPDVQIRDESWDGTKKLVYADTGSTPGRYYIYDATARKLGPLLSVYPALDDVALGTVKAVKFAARDGTMIPGYLTLPPGKTDARGLPGLVMPHGGPSARDAAGFDWLAQFFAAEGFAVLQPNFRGSAGYGDAFFAKNGFKSWPLAIGDVNDGGRWLIAQGVAADRLAIFGWSYGGYAALQANVVEPHLYRAAIAVAPVTDLELLRNEYLHFTSFKLIDAQIGQGPHVLSGSPARNAAKIAAPVLIFHADHDLNVDIAQSRAMVGALKGAGRTVQFVEYKSLDHQIDDSVAREDMLTKSAAFLKAAMN